ncbi:MAG: S-layer protein domain-containing protein, partial [Methanosarcinales archaeon]
MSAVKNGIHANLNNALINANLACYACHGDPNKVDIQKIMNKDNSKQCKDCHLTGDFSAPKIKEHNPYGENILTKASCIDCHANSHVSYSDLSITPRSVVSHYGEVPKVESTDCMYCHSSLENGKLWGSALQVTPENMYGATTKEDCYDCHTTTGSPPNDLHDSTLTSEADFRDCINCHTIDTSAIKEAIHANLNNAISNVNDLCYACHGNPNKVDIQKVMNTTNALQCKDCHTTGNFNAPQIYSHYLGSKEINTSVSCGSCHSNSLTYYISAAKELSTSMKVALYGTSENLINSSDCVYCHIELRSNSTEEWKKWGSAPDPRDFIDWEKVEINLKKNSIWKLENGYSIKVEEVDLDGKKAKLVLILNGEKIDSEIVSEGDYFEYHTKLPKIHEHNFPSNLSSEITNRLGEYGGQKGDLTIVNLTLKKVFRSQEDYFASLEGIIIKRRHKETQSNQCYACHVNDYKYGEWHEYEGKDKEGMDFMVLDTDINTDTSAYNVTLSRTPINFSDTDEKTLKENETWQLGDGYVLKVKNIDLEGKKAELALLKEIESSAEEFSQPSDGKEKENKKDEIVNENGIFDYDIKLIKNKPNITIFTATLNKVFRSGSVNLITLKKVKYVS